MDLYVPGRRGASQFTWYTSLYTLKLRLRFCEYILLGLRCPKTIMSVVFIFVIMTTAKSNQIKQKKKCRTEHDLKTSSRRSFSFEL